MEEKLETKIDLEDLRGYDILVDSEEAVAQIDSNEFIFFISQIGSTKKMIEQMTSGMTEEQMFFFKMGVNFITYDKKLDKLFDILKEELRIKYGYDGSFSITKDGKVIELDEDFGETSEGIYYESPQQKYHR